MKDFTEHKKLYLLCFTEDTAEDADLLFEKVFSKAEMLCEYNEAGLPIAMLYLMDAKIVSKSSSEDYYYLYAACTHPSYRGKGIMGDLLEKAKTEAIKNGKQGIFLKPANPSLFNFYAKSDFLPYFSICKINMPSEDFLEKHPPEQVKTTLSTIDNWKITRKKLLDLLNSDFVDFNSDMLSAAADGCNVIIGEGYGFVFEKRDSLFLVKEAICEKGKMNTLLSSISYELQNENCTDIEIRMPPALKSELSEFNNILKPFSVMWFADPKKSYENGAHHGFAFD